MIFFKETFYRFFIVLCIAISSTAIISSETEEVEEVVVKGNVLYSDQVQALKTPVPILDVPQTLSIVTDEESASKYRVLIASMTAIRPPSLARCRTGRNENLLRTCLQYGTRSQSP